MLDYKEQKWFNHNLDNSTQSPYLLNNDFKKLHNKEEHH